MVLNRINLEIINAIPLDGVDTHIACSGCAAACCRKGVVMSLSANEVEFLDEAGTGLEKFDTSERSKIGKLVHRLTVPPSEERELMKLTTDCGHLDVDEVTGRLICDAYYDESRPEVCGDFRVGSFVCALLQLKRLRQDQSRD